MPQKQCDKCSEMVDEAKAFCPGCGNSFVIESKREVRSNFDSFEGTINLGDTMFNKMLSDMGLNISKEAPPQPAEKRPEVISLQPAAPPTPAPVASQPASNAKWFILGGVVLILIFLLILAVAVVIFILWPRLT
jgi:hypothetical protein